MKEIISTSSELTQQLAYKIGQHIPPGAILILSGELGAGKTTFAQGLAKGLGVSEQVTSPTFMVAQTYHSGRLPFSHLDAYRLENADIYGQGLDEYWQEDAVTLIEWGEILAPILPESAVFISLFYQQDNFPEAFGDNLPHDEGLKTEELKTEKMEDARRIVFHIGNCSWLEEVLNCIS